MIQSSRVQAAEPIGLANYTRRTGLTDAEACVCRDHVRLLPKRTTDRLAENVSYWPLADPDPRRMSLP